MNNLALYLINGDKRLIDFQTDPSSILSYPVFPGGIALKFENSDLKLLVKEIASDLFTIRHKIFRFSKRQKIEAVSGSPGIHSRVMLQNNLRLTIDSVGELDQKEGTISLLSGQVKSCVTTFEAGVEYKMLDLYAGNDLAAQLAQFFPQLDFNSEAVRNLLPYPCFISPSLHKVIDEILDCPYDEATSHFHFDVKVREFFFKILHESNPSMVPKYHYSPFEMEGLLLAREILLSDLSKPPLTVRELAHKAGLNELKLKVGFSHFFKTGVFECFQRARMNKAKQLVLQTNKPLKEICTMAGYPRMTNFITAFRNFYGRTPGSFRR